MLTAAIIVSALAGFTLGLCVRSVPAMRLGTRIGVRAGLRAGIRRGEQRAKRQVLERIDELKSEMGITD